MDVSIPLSSLVLGKSQKNNTIGKVSESVLLFFYRSQNLSQLTFTLTSIHLIKIIVLNEVRATQNVIVYRLSGKTIQ